jgi:hypothetical protein
VDEVRAVALECVAAGVRACGRAGLRWQGRLPPAAPAAGARASSARNGRGACSEPRGDDGRTPTRPGDRDGRALNSSGGRGGACGHESAAPPRRVDHGEWSQRNQRAARPDDTTSRTDSRAARNFGQYPPRTTASALNARPSPTLHECSDRRRSAISW